MNREPTPTFGPTEQEPGHGTYTDNTRPGYIDTSEMKFKETIEKLADIIDSPDGLLLIDADNVLLKSYVLSAEVYTALEKKFPALENLIQGVKAREQPGKSFAYLDELTKSTEEADDSQEKEELLGLLKDPEKLAESMIEGLSDEEIDALSERIIEDGAFEIMKYAVTDDSDPEKATKGLLYTSGDVITQRFKIRLLELLYEHYSKRNHTNPQTGVELQFIILDPRKQKADMIQASTNYDGDQPEISIQELAEKGTRYRIKGALLSSKFRRAALLDDKKKNLDGDVFMYESPEHRSDLLLGVQIHPAGKDRLPYETIPKLREVVDVLVENLKS